MVSPDTTSAPSPRPDVGSPAAARRRSERARQAFVAPWSHKRARRARAIAFALLAVGPLVGTLFALVLVPAEPANVVTGDRDGEAMLHVDGTVRSVDAATGEMAVRLTVTDPDGEVGNDPRDEDELFREGGVLTEEVTLLLNDATGLGVRTLPADQAPGSLGLVVALSGSRATRYPVDRYRTTIVVQALRGGLDGEPIPLRLDLRSDESQFSTSLVEDASVTDLAIVNLRVQRRWTVIGWGLFFIVLCWMLAVSAASIGWMSIVHGIASPFWCWGFLIGVLFALPPLRSALPGNAPGGSLVDFAAFYWAIGIVTLTLVAMVGSWNLRVRQQPNNPDAPRP